MKELGANVARVHLQFGKFMSSADTPSTGALRNLTRILALAESTEVYLDITGLACYRPSDTPPWYDSLSEAKRWSSQQIFWEAIADTCTTSPAVFCYDLINEPLVPGERRDKWYSGELFGGFDYLQFVSLDPAGRKRED